LAYLTRDKAKFWKKLIITLVFEKNANFRQKCVKIAENCDHNIDPWYINQFTIFFILKGSWNCKCFVWQATVPYNYSYNSFRLKTDHWAHILSQKTQFFQDAVAAMVIRVLTSIKQNQVQLVKKLSPTYLNFKGFSSLGFESGPAFINPAYLSSQLGCLFVPVLWKFRTGQAFL
jgi:hypothetical protein